MSTWSIDELKTALDKLPPTRAKRICAVALDMARDATHAQEISSIRQQIEDLQKKVETPTPKHGKLYSSREAWSYIAKSERTFRNYVGAGLIKPVNPEVLNGEHHRFTQVALDKFLKEPTGTVRTAVSLWLIRKKREAKEQSKT